MIPHFNDNEILKKENYDILSRYFTLPPYDEENFDEIKKLYYLAKEKEFEVRETFIFIRLLVFVIFYLIIVYLVIYDLISIPFSILISFPVIFYLYLYYVTKKRFQKDGVKY